jgi:hypothetical protein
MAAEDFRVWTLSTFAPALPNRVRTADWGADRSPL